MFARWRRPAVPDLPRLGWQPLSEAAAGQYAMWTPTPGDEDFTTSPSAALLDEIYTLLEPIRALAGASLAREVGWVRDHPRTRSVPLPAELTSAHVSTPHGVRFIVTASAEKGLRLHFGADTALAVREALLEQLRDHLTALHTLPDPRATASVDPSPAGWWRLMRQALAESPPGTSNAAQAVGVVQF